MAAKKKKSGAGSKGKAANASSDSSTATSKTAKTQKRSASTSSFTADVGGDGLAAQLPEGFFIKRMPADGNCLFSAVDDQVTCLLESDPGALSSRRWSNFLASCSTLAPSPSSSSSSSSSSSTSFSPTSLLAAAAAKTAASATKGLPRGQAELRAAAALWIAGHPTTFAPFLGDGDPRTVALQYAGRMARDAAWGGQAEQVALCQLLGVRLRVFQAGQQPWIMEPPMPEPEEEEAEREKAEGKEGEEGWSKPRKTAKKKKSSSGGDSSSSAPQNRPSENGHAEASPLPVINISYHNGEHYNSVRRQPLDSREAAAAAAARHLRDKEAVAKALAALGEIDGGGGGSSKKKKKQQQQQQQERDEQKPESPSEEAAEAATTSAAAAGEEKDEGEGGAEEGKEQQPAAAAVAAPSATAAALQQKKNDACACGSGLRYKSCCRPRDRARARTAALAEAAGVDVSELARKLGDGDGDELAARLKELVV